VKDEALTKEGGGKKCVCCTYLEARLRGSISRKSGAPMTVMAVPRVVFTAIRSGEGGSGIADSSPMSIEEWIRSIESRMEPISGCDWFPSFCLKNSPPGEKNLCTNRY